MTTDQTSNLTSWDGETRVKSYNSPFFLKAFFVSLRTFHAVPRVANLFMNLMFYFTNYRHNYTSIHSSADSFSWASSAARWDSSSDSLIAMSSFGDADPDDTGWWAVGGGGGDGE